MHHSPIHHHKKGTSVHPIRFTLKHRKGIIAIIIGGIALFWNLSNTSPAGAATPSTKSTPTASAPWSTIDHVSVLRPTGKYSKAFGNTIDVALVRRLQVQDVFLDINGDHAVRAWSPIACPLFDTGRLVFTLDAIQKLDKRMDAPIMKIPGTEFRGAMPVFTLMMPFRSPVKPKDAAKIAGRALQTMEKLGTCQGGGRA